MKTLLIILAFVCILFANKPKLLLLKTYKDQNTTNWVMSEKLDGIRAYWNGKNLITRNGHIINAPKYFTKDYPPFEIDGELWTKRNDFDNISSIIRDKKPSKKWHNIKHYIFEVPNAKGDLFDRLKLVKPYEGKYIKIIKQIKIKNKTHLRNYFKKLTSKGAEGLVVRDPKIGYINKRTSKALKLKSYKDAECKIIGYTKGKGKFKDLVGSIKCQLSNKNIIKIGSGLNDNFRNNPPKINTIITFKYYNMTSKNNPRFPVFLRIKKEF